MKSLPDSHKNELFERLFDSITDEYGKPEVPPEDRIMVLWDFDGTAEEKVKAREKEIMQKYGTVEGFEPLVCSWVDQDGNDFEFDDLL